MPYEQTPSTYWKDQSNLHQEKFLGIPPTPTDVLQVQKNLQLRSEDGEMVTPEQHLLVDSPANMLLYNPEAPNEEPIFDPEYGSAFNTFSISDFDFRYPAYKVYRRS